MPTTYAIPNGRTVMDATTITSTGTTQVITNSGGFQPDLVWSKSRSTSNIHLLFDSQRGVSNYLSSDTTSADTNYPNFLTSFNSNGFTLGTAQYLNGVTNVAWQWKAGGTGVSNTSGTITSTVSANTTAGFSIATFTCTGVNVNGTVGHGLGVAPNFIITKSLGSASNWVVYHSSVSTDVNKFLRLNDTSALTTLSQIWGDALPTSTVFGIRGDVTLAASATAVAYCWAQVAGFSAFGSYTGNGSTDGPFIYTGFRPKFVMMKSTSDTGSWILLDSARSTYNASDAILYPNLSNAEDSGRPMDFLSNGFKLRQGTYDPNKSSVTYIYAAFAENPFKYANAR